MDLSIDELRKISSIENIEITLHAAKRLEQRGISIHDILSCIKTGKIIEQYTDDYPYPSCLILGMTVKQTYLHVVAASDMVTLWIITAYFPNSEKWEDNLETRKGAHK